MSFSAEQEFTTEVAASVDQCFATVTEFERYPEWFSPIEKTTVLARHRNGLAKQVEIRINMRVKTIRYVLEYEYRQPAELTWKAVDGDIESIEGAYVFEKLG